jgi:hypothetical protein
MINDPEIASSKGKFKRQLARTIKGEYLDSQDVAETEFWISTWRAVLSLTYHVPLECRMFGKATINGHIARKKTMLYNGDVIEIGDNIAISAEEILPIPPQHILHICTPEETIDITTNVRALLTNPDESTRFVIIKDNNVIFGPASPKAKSHRTKINGDFSQTNAKIGDICRIVEGRDKGLEVVIGKVTPESIHMGDPQPLVIGSDPEVMRMAYNELKDEYSPSQLDPQMVVLPAVKPIHLIIRSRRTNPEVIFDDSQMRKLVKNYGWELFGQIIKENKRPMSKTPKIIKGSADAVALQIITSLFSSGKESIKYEVVNNASMIKTSTGLLPMWIVTKIGELKREFIALNVDIKVVEGEGIYIKPIGMTPTISRRIVDAQYIQTKSFDDQYNQDSDQTVRDVLESQIADKTKTATNLNSLFSSDAMRELISRLPPKIVEYVQLRACPPLDFDEKFGNHPKRSDVASYLGIHPNEIKKFDSIIRMQMLALGMGPDSPQT